MLFHARSFTCIFSKYVKGTESNSPSSALVVYRFVVCVLTSCTSFPLCNTDAVNGDHQQFIKWNGII